MAKITRADVHGKSQNRTALGMMNAYLAMFPSVTIDQLKNGFSKQAVCPDAGVGQLFFTIEEIEAGIASGNTWFVEDGAAFTKEGEWLTLKNGQKLAFNKMWTANSLAIFQKHMVQYQIFGRVDKTVKAPTGFKIDYQYQEQPKKGLPVWVWLLALLVLAALAYFLFR
ncbi:hypothetical protein [Moraxella bovoculi]|uniref:hypothetical protein n=1 Tax=Moraxella bovoculi TaxID=386891 RepID=UPI0006243490|nr:hypothetical protein [Moraxella bovoculi]AKG16301.2 hypothetical protein AAX08_08365 [Moraxella bovoculi]AKG17601.1 hypothetical protein AAX10_08050 [Moraxella bovoculi]